MEIEKHALWKLRNMHSTTSPSTLVEHVTQQQRDYIPYFWQKQRKYAYETGTERLMGNTLPWFLLIINELRFLYECL